MTGAHPDSGRHCKPSCHPLGSSASRERQVLFALHAGVSVNFPSPSCSLEMHHFCQQHLSPMLVMVFHGLSLIVLQYMCYLLLPACFWSLLLLRLCSLMVVAMCKSAVVDKAELNCTRLSEISTAASIKSTGGCFDPTHYLSQCHCSCRQSMILHKFDQVLCNGC